jgi:pSer/pThr/pTyr-binding forkhead associated (FHA) protein
MPKLVVIKGPLKDQVFDLGNNDTVFCGRYPRMNDIAILDITVSRKHFKIFRIGNDLFVEDLKSKHGTLINGKLIKAGEGFQVREGDIITIGNTVIRLDEVSGRGSLIKMESMPTNTKRASSKEQRSAKEIELVYKVSELLKRQMNIKTFFEEVLDLLLEVLPRVDNANIFLFKNEKTQVIDAITKSHEISVNRYSRKILNRVIRDHKTVRISNTDFEPLEDYAETGEILEIKSVLCVPIVSSDEILGAIYIDSKKPYGFRKEDQLLLNSLVGPMAVAIEKDRLVHDSGSDQIIHLKKKLINFIQKIDLK